MVTRTQFSIYAHPAQNARIFMEPKSSETLSLETFDVFFTNAEKVLNVVGYFSPQGAVLRICLAAFQALLSFIAPNRQPSSFHGRQTNLLNGNRSMDYALHALANLVRSQIESSPIPGVCLFAYDLVNRVRYPHEQPWRY